MITVEEAEKLVLAQAADYGNEIIPFDMALGRVLAETIKADRDLPPFNRATLDGIAINYGSIEKGIRLFNIKATQAAGDIPVNINSQDECIEIMTGASLPASVDTIIPYEHIDIKDSIATITNPVAQKGQNLHLK